MKSKTHKRATRTMFPGIDPLVIDAVNSILDDPPAWLSFLPSIGRLPGLSYRGHRARGGHDILTGSIAGLMTGGFPGMPVVLLHWFLDLTRDMIVEKLGTSKADLAEDVFHVLCELVEEKNGMAKGRSWKITSKKS